MPRYFFDIHGDVAAVSDTEGAVFANRDKAGKHAAQILAEIALHNPPENGCCHLLALVRDEAERVVFTTTLNVVGKPVDAPILLPGCRVGAVRTHSPAA
ncbi:DUF6894 family protein [Methylobacterium oxalidis]|uniref:DUF6894 family protein n=1 Tax=Methylobacterium oxalidis TaxID=944322 RepID=UPI003316285C